MMSGLNRANHSAAPIPANDSRARESRFTFDSQSTFDQGKTRHGVCTGPGPMRMAAIASLLSLLVSGCLTHMPPVGDRHMKIHWAPDWEVAARQAAAEGKPVLVCLVAGEITGLC
jgi:hypothetical protein